MDGIVDCPHCFGRVLAAADGTCPSCGKKTTDRSGAHPDIAAVRISHGQEMPDCCLLCGQSGTSLFQIGGMTNREIKKSIGLSVIGLTIAFLTGIGFYRTPGDEYPFSVKIPLCHRCLRQKPKPHHVDIVNQIMTFLAHKTFKNRFERGT